MQRVVQHLHEYYVDLDRCIEWSAYGYVARPACLAWYWAPISRHGTRVAGCERLYLANTTVESDAGPVDISAHAGLLAAEAILEDAPVEPAERLD